MIKMRCSISNHGSGIWKPGFTDNGYIFGFLALSEAIRTASHCEVKKEMVNGEDQYIVTFETYEGKMRVKASNGEEIEVNKGRGYRVWLSPRMGLAATRMEQLLGWGLAEITGECIASDFREISPGVWWPYRLERGGISKDDRVQILVVEKVAINEEAVVPERLNFPPGTYVKDEIKGIEYRTGLPDEVVDAAIADSMRTIHAAQDGKASLPDSGGSRSGEVRVADPCEVKGPEQTDNRELVGVAEQPTRSGSWSSKKAAAFIVAAIAIVCVIIVGGFLVRRTRRQ